MAKLKIYRQGDVLFVKVRGFGKRKLRKLDHKVIAEGEETGHKHEIIEDNAVLYQEINNASALVEDSQINDMNMCLEALSDTRVFHNEHDIIGLPKGKYIVVKQRQYSDHQLNRFDLYNRGRDIRNVAD